MIDETCRIGVQPFSFLTNPEGDRQQVLGDKGVWVSNPTTTIRPFTCIESGIDNPTKIGMNTIIGSHCNISHDVQIGKNVEIDPHVTILGYAEIGDYSRICTGAVIHQKIKVGIGCVVGANSYLRENLLGGRIAYGNPAKVKYNTHYDKVRDKPWIK